MTFLKSTITLPDSTKKKRSTSALTSLAWAAVILFEAWLLLNDVILFNGRPVADLETPEGALAAQLKEMANVVRVQNPGDLLWREGRPGQPLYEGQTVLTLEKSSASLAFEEGQLVLLDANSLAQIQANGRAGSQSAPEALVLLRGALTGRFNRPMAIVSGRVKAKVGGGAEIRVAAPSGAGSDGFVEVVKGSVDLVSPKGQISVRPGERAILDARDPDSIRKAPALEEAAATPSPSPSPTASPAPVATPVPTAVPRSSKRLAPPRLRPPQFLKRRTEIAPSRSFPWWGFFLPEARAAEDAPAGSWEVKLTWDAVPGAAGYVVQVGRTRRFATLVGEAKTKEPEWIWLYRSGMENSKGRVFYRVASVSSTGQVGAFSEAVPIEIPKEKHGPGSAIAARPPPSPSPSPRPAAVDSKPSRWRRWTAVLSGGVTSLQQTSGARDLEKVRLKSPFLHEALEVQADFGAASRHLQFLARGELEKYKSAGANTPSQPEQRTWGMNLEGRVWSVRERWNWAWGGLIDRSYRWVKDSPTTASAQGTWSIGPLLGGMRQWRSENGSQPMELGAAVAFPVSGVLSGGQLGASAEVWALWPLSRRFALQFRGNASYLAWDEPESTHVSRYSAFLGVGYHFISWP